MPVFTVRVELKGTPTYETYERLHTLMTSFGFAKSINGVDPTGAARTFSLPTGTYYGSRSEAAADVRTLLTQAIKAQIQPAISVFVAETSTWAIGG